MMPTQTPTHGCIPAAVFPDGVSLRGLQAKIADPLHAVAKPRRICNIPHSAAMGILGTSPHPAEHETRTRVDASERVRDTLLCV